jgi:hypothetical protein
LVGEQQQIIVRGERSTNSSQQRSSASKRDYWLWKVAEGRKSRMRRKGLGEGKGERFVVDGDRWMGKRSLGGRPGTRRVLK